MVKVTKWYTFINRVYVCYVFDNNLMSTSVAFDYIVYYLTPVVLHIEPFYVTLFPWASIREWTGGRAPPPIPCLVGKGTQYQMSPSRIGQNNLLIGRKLPFMCFWPYLNILSIKMTIFARIIHNIWRFHLVFGAFSAKFVISTLHVFLTILSIKVTNFRWCWMSSQSLPFHILKAVVQNILWRHNLNAPLRWNIHHITRGAWCVFRMFLISYLYSGL